MDAGRGNSFPVERTRAQGEIPVTTTSALLEFGSTTIKLYRSRFAPLARGSWPRTPIEEAKIPWDLGHDVFEIGRIRRQTIDRCVYVLQDLLLRYSDLDLRAMPAVGTSALREAANADRLQEAIREAFGLELHIIGSDTEAHLLGAGFRDRVSEYPTALFDLGGGSLELVQYLGPRITRTSSLPLGAVRLHCSLQHNRDRSVYAEEGRRLAAAIIRRHLKDRTPRYREMAGTGGTMRAAVRLAGKEALTGVDVERLTRRALDDDLGDELEPHRRRVLLAGLLILRSLVATLHLERIVHRRASVKRGLIELVGALPANGCAVH